MTGAAQAILEHIWPGLAAGGLAAGLLPWLKRDWPAARMFLMGVSIVLLLRYVAWRILETVPPAGFTLDFLAGTTFTFVETVALLGSAVNLLFLSRIKDRTKEADEHAGWFARPPLIDVFICTYNEEEAILERTIIGAQAMDYGNFRVWVCDDGRRDWLKKMCERSGCGYIVRPGNLHAKAGNINNALNWVSALPEPPQFIAILDADFVPRRNFLSRGVSLFYAADVGIVQTPQHFINPDPIQANLSTAEVWPDEQRYFFDVVMASKDAWGTAFCCGTSSIIRYEPLAAIGGVPVDSVTEDYLLTLRMKEAGYRTVYLNEPLTLGLAPEGLKEYITQRSRWCLGFVQIFRGRSGPFSRSSNLPLADRVFLAESFTYWAGNYSYRLLGMVVPILYLLFGIRTVYADMRELLLYFLPYFVWHFIVIGWMAQGRVLVIMTDVCQLIAAPAVMKSVAIGLFRPWNQKFEVTAKGGDRSKRFIEWPLLRFFLSLLVLTIIGVEWSMFAGGGMREDPSGAMALAWSWYNIAILTIACYVCIEQPRLRKSERFTASRRVEAVLGDGRKAMLDMADVSISGARFTGAPLAAYGERLGIAIAGHAIGAMVVRVSQKDFAVHFDDSLLNRVLMIRHIYSELYVKEFRGVRLHLVGKAVLERLLR
ncbi:MAG: glycosyltransferase [Hyphomicrobiales bacterium]